jgi:LPS-assembly protein
VRHFLACTLASLLIAGPAAAQAPPAAPAPPTAAPVQPAAAPASPADTMRSLFESAQQQLRFIPPDHFQSIGQVDLPIPGANGGRIFADRLDIFFDKQLLVAEGNVAFTGSEGRISAERVEFNLGSGAATFYDAMGIVSIPDANPAEFGNQDPDVYFYGSKIEKLGPKKYRITRGGFSTCVQPTPRWEVTTTSLDLNLDDYALARGAVLRVKGVPLLYLPAIYYPLQEDQRSTGFLLPTYGTSTIRGGALSNAFFWAINRSQDATFFHDWFTRAGQGAGGEYRYVANAGSSGEMRFYRFAQRQSTFTNGNQTGVLPAGTSYEVRGSMVHALRPGVTIRGRVEYASDLVTQQLYQQNVYQASYPIRTIEGSFAGSWGALSTNALFQRTELFSSRTSSTLSGSTPRISSAIAPTRMFGLPLYGSVSGEYANLPYESRSDGRVTSDNSLARFELAPTLRVPLTALSYLSVNSTASYRTTYFDRSRDASGRPSDEPVGRSYFAFRSDIVGPVLTKIWDTPESETIDRMKHVIEPTFSIDHVTDITNAALVPSLSHISDVVVGGSTRVTYGLNNRFLYRSRPTGATRTSSQEFLTIGVQQTYYTNPEASRWDYQYQVSTSRARPVDLSPIAVTTRLAPNASISANSRLEYDVTGLGLQVLSFGGSVSSTATSANATFSRVVYSPSSKTSVLAVSDTLRFLQGRATGTYSLSWDLERSYVVSQSVTGSYLAQCCGLQVEYQQYNFPDLIGFPVSADRRLNFGFVLAGLGTFSNFFGAFGGQP